MLKRCLMTGTIPSSLGLLTDMIALRLPSNKLVGTIPPELGHLTAVTNLDLGDNLLTG